MVINTSYPGASAQTLEDSVLSVIEREMNGSPGLIYMESVSQADGTGTITLSFEAGTNPTWPRWTCRTGSRATPRLPAAVTQQGVRVDKSRSNFLLFIMLSSENGAYDPIAGRLRLAQRDARNPAPARRGPGPAVRHRARHAHLDRPGQAEGYNLSPADVNAAIGAERPGVRGRIGDLPNITGQGIAATVVVKGQLATVEQFGASCCAPTPTAPPCA
jgi:multidrug efflux pump